MYNQNEFLDASGNLSHEAVRAHFLRTGKLDGLVKGEEVYIDFECRWMRVRLIRRCPGDIWIAKPVIPLPMGNKVTVSVVNFGGKCA
jgi:hypothetical protein